MSDSAPPPPPHDPNRPQQPPAAGPDPSSPPPGQPAQPAQPPPGQSARPRSSGASGMTSDQLKSTVQSAHKFDLGIIGAGLLAFFLSFFPYYTASVETSGSPAGLDIGSLGGESDSWSAWHGFFGWFAVLLALAAVVVLVLNLMNIVLPVPVHLTVLGLFAGALLCTVLAFFVNPIPGEEGKESFGGVTFEASKGHGIGFWLVLIVIAAGLALSVMRKDAD